MPINSTISSFAMFSEPSASAILNIEDATRDNKAYRRVWSTTPQQQLVLMSLLPEQEIGAETHKHHTQFIRVEQGKAFVRLNDQVFVATDGDAITIPPGTYHNITNISRKYSLKLYTIYSPPMHAPGLLQRLKNNHD